MKNIEITLSDPLYYRLQKISEITGIKLNEILQLCLIDGGYYRYWINIEKFIEDTPYLIDEINSTDSIYDIMLDLNKQFHERIEIVDDIDLLESEFRKKIKNFDTDVEQHRAFLDFIDFFQVEKKIEDSQISEIKEVPPVIQEEQEISKELDEETILQEKVVLPFKLLPRKYVPMLILIAIADFLMIKVLQLFWPHFTFFNILQFNPLQLIPYFLLIISTSFFTGILYYYYYNKYKASIPLRKETKELKEYIKEFDIQNPRTYSKDPITQLDNDIKRLQELQTFIETKTSRRIISKKNKKAI